MIVVASGVAITACADHTPARIAFRTDSLVVNTNQWTPLDMRVLDRGGRVVETPKVHLDVDPDTLLRIRSDGSISCRDDGVASVNATVATARGRMVVQCHLVRHFSPPVARGLIASGPPVPFVMTGYDRDGRPIEPLHVELVTRDTTVVRLRGGLVYGLKPGATDITAKSLAESGGMVFFVRAPMCRDSTLRRGPAACKLHPDSVRR
ncbi:MAG: hypothetical protein ACRENQ_05560 [Gemmatimonadaceae bacterium]